MTSLPDPFQNSELVNCRDVFEHERKIKDTEDLCEGFELGQGRRCKLDITLKHSFENLIIILEG